MKLYNRTGVKSILLLLLISFIVVPLILDTLQIKYKEGMETTGETTEETTGETTEIVTQDPTPLTDAGTGGVVTQNNSSMDLSITEESESAEVTNTVPGEDTENIQNETDPGVVPSNIDYVDRIVNDVGKHMYCLGGNVYCKYDTAELQFIENYEFGKTYKDKCSDDTNVMCNNYLRNEDVESLKFYEYNKETKEPVEESIVGYNESEINIGFTQPLDYTPLDLKAGEDYMIYYKPNGDKFKTDRCALFGPDKCIQGNIEDQGASEECPQSVQIKCLANYGTKIGDPLCCDQPGVLQNTSNICPEEMPNCVGYKCGTQWGTCMKNEPVKTPTEVETNPETIPQ